MLALIAGTVSYLHMHALVALHGEPGWVAAPMPLSVDGMIVAASTTLLTESRPGGRGGALPWALLVIGSVASLVANLAVAEPTVIRRAIAAWPSFALIGSYELLMRQVRWAASPDRGRVAVPTKPAREESPVTAMSAASPTRSPSAEPGADARRQVWQWAVANSNADGSLPSGKVIGTGGMRGGAGWSRRLALPASSADAAFS